MLAIWELYPLFMCMGHFGIRFVWLWEECTIAVNRAVSDIQEVAQSWNIFQ